MIVLHDYMEHTDGGSRLCLELARHFPAALLCGFVRRGHPFLHGPLPELSTLMPAVPVPLLRQWLLALAFSHARRGKNSVRRAVQGQDGAIFSGSYAPLAVRHCDPHTRTLLYCHTPPRFLYDQRAAFTATACRTMAPRLLRNVLPVRHLLHAFCAWLQPRYEAAVARMDAIAVNSEAVRQRVLHYLGRDARVIHPPCQLDIYTWDQPQNFYLSMVRLDSLKRVEVSLRAFARMPDKQLVVLSDGPEAAALHRLAAGAPNIRFAGAVSEGERLRLLSQCIATVCTAREEDFGMCAVESLAAGKPVLAAHAGGLAEICASSDYCFTLPADPEPEDVCEAVQRCDAATATAMRRACQARAEAFSLPRFIHEVREMMEQNNAF